MAGYNHSQENQSVTKEVTVVEVRNPVTHDNGTLKKTYTDYEVCIKTTSKAFIIPQSFVRRRYSDFVWLKNWLEKQNDAFSRVKMPKLPPKKLVGRNDPEFIEKRRHGLQKFLRKIIKHNVFLSDKALHLFLQSGMHVNQIDNYLSCGNQNFIDNSDALVSHFEKENKNATQSVLQSISESILNTSTEDSTHRKSSSFSSISSSLLDSFEAINVEDCFEGNETQSSQYQASVQGKNISKITEISHLDTNEGVDEDKDSLDVTTEDLNFGLLLDGKENSQNLSNNSLAECDQG